MITAECRIIFMPVLSACSVFQTWQIFVVIKQKKSLTVFFPRFKINTSHGKDFNIFFSLVIIRPILLFLKRGGNQHAVDENGEVSMAISRLECFFICSVILLAEENFGNSM